MAKDDAKSVDLNEFSLKMREETDRACAVLGAALLDMKLKQLFRRRLRGDGESLLGGMAPLSSFSSRIRLALALAWVSDPVASDLDVIRDIRNDFAHSFDHGLSFGAHSVSARCQNLKSAESYLAGHDAAARVPHPNFSDQVIRAMKEAVSSPRWRFELAVTFLSQHLDELPGQAPPYEGPDLLAECFALGGGPRVRINLVGTTG